MHKWLYPVYVDVFQVLHVYQEGSPVVLTLFRGCQP